MTIDHALTVERSAPNHGEWSGYVNLWRIRTVYYQGRWLHPLFPAAGCFEIVRLPVSANKYRQKGIALHYKIRIFLVKVGNIFSWRRWYLSVPNTPSKSSCGRAMQQEPMKTISCFVAVATLQQRWLHWSSLLMLKMVSTVQNVTKAPSAANLTKLRGSGKKCWREAPNTRRTYCPHQLLPPQTIRGPVAMATSQAVSNTSCNLQQTKRALEQHNKTAAPPRVRGTKTTRKSLWWDESKLSGLRDPRQGLANAASRQQRSSACEDHITLPQISWRYRRNPVGKISDSNCDTRRAAKRRQNLSDPVLIRQFPSRIRIENVQIAIELSTQIETSNFQIPVKFKTLELDFGRSHISKFWKKLGENGLVVTSPYLH